MENITEASSVTRNKQSSTKNDHPLVSPDVRLSAAYILVMNLIFNVSKSRCSEGYLLQVRYWLLLLELSLKVNYRNGCIHMMPFYSCWPLDALQHKPQQPQWHTYEYIAFYSMHRVHFCSNAQQPHKKQYREGQDWAVILIFNF